MRISKLKFAAAAALLLASASCSGDAVGSGGGAKSYSVRGTWKATVGALTHSEFLITLDEVDGRISGTGTLANEELGYNNGAVGAVPDPHPDTLTVTGTRTGDQVTMLMTSAPSNYHLQGQFTDGRTIAAVVNTVHMEFKKQ